MNGLRRLDVLRRLLLGLFALGSVGVCTELVLLDHMEDTLQWVPLTLLGVAFGMFGWLVVAGSVASVRAFRAIMFLFVIAGCLGLVLHYKGNVEFELEMYPSVHGFTLFREAITGATPALAPGTMILLGLLGLITCYRHSAVAHTTANNNGGGMS